MHPEHEEHHKPRNGKRWWQTRNGIATALLLAIVAVYLVTEHLMHIYQALPFIDFLTPYHYADRYYDNAYAPPQPLRLWHDGAFIGPHTYPTSQSFAMETFKVETLIDWSQPQPLRFMAN